MCKLKRANGKWVTGDEFWGREKDVELFMELVNEGASIQLLAQRRMGKTSLMREVARRMENQGRHTCLFVDLEKAEGAEEAIVDLSLAARAHAGLWKKVTGVFRNTLAKILDKIDSVGNDVIRITLREGLSSGNWQAMGDGIFAALASSELPVVVFLDEVPILVNRMLKGNDYRITPERRERTDVFMHWLRENRQRHQDKIRIVVSGSIGFEPVLGQAGLSGTIAGLHPFELEAWDDATACGCLEALGHQYGITFSEGACKQMTKLLGCCIPHHVQMFFDRLYEYCKRRGEMECTVEDAESAYERYMLSTRGIAELNHYEERLRMVLGPELAPFAEELLSEAATEGRLTPEACDILRRDYPMEEEDPVTVQRQILEILQHDGYLQKTPSGFVFVSHLLRDWWKGRYDTFYTPASRRGV